MCRARLLDNPAGVFTGRSLTEAGLRVDALDAYSHGIEAARAKGDRQAEKEMTVFRKRLEKAVPGPRKDSK